MSECPRHPEALFGHPKKINILYVAVRTDTPYFNARFIILVKIGTNGINFWPKSMILHFLMLSVPCMSNQDKETLKLIVLLGIVSNPIRTPRIFQNGGLGFPKNNHGKILRTPLKKEQNMPKQSQYGHFRKYFENHPLFFSIISLMLKHHKGFKFTQIPILKLSFSPKFVPKTPKMSKIDIFQVFAVKSVWSVKLVSQPIPLVNESVSQSSSLFTQQSSQSINQAVRQSCRSSFFLFLLRF